MKRSPSILIAAFAVAALALPAQAAGDAAAGKAKAASCGGCHGANGQGQGPNPPIAGKSETEFVQSLKDYKSGKKNHAMMKSLVANFSDADMANLAAYYASLKGK